MTETEPIKVQVVNHPQPQKYTYRAAYRTCRLTTTNPYEQIAGSDPLRVYIRFTPPLANVIICNSISEASDPNNAAGPATAKPIGRIISSGSGEYITEGQNEIWLVTATSNLPLNIGYEIIRKVPE